MPGGFDIAAEFRAGKSAQRGAGLRHRLRHAAALVQHQWHRDAPTWADWQLRQRALDAAMPPSFVAAMRLAHGGSDAHLDDNSATTADSDHRAAWLAARLPMTVANVAAVWQALATHYDIAVATAAAVTFVLDASHGQCRVVVPGRVVEVRLRSGASAAAWHDCLHELGHAVVALSTVLDVPRAVDEAVADVVAAQLLHGPATSIASPLAIFSDLAQVAPQMRQHRLAIAQRLAIAESTLRPTTAARPPWALWHDPGAQTAYVAAAALAEPLLPNGLAGRPALVAFVEQATHIVDVGIAARAGAA